MGSVKGRAVKSSHSTCTRRAKPTRQCYAVTRGRTAAFVPSSRGGVLLDKLLNAVRRLRADRYPVVIPFLSYSKGFFVLCRDRVKKPDALDVSAITPIPAVSDYDVVERPFLSAGA